MDNNYYKIAEDYYNNGEYEKAFKDYQLGANNGDAFCINALGYCYGEGIGVEKDPYLELGYNMSVNDYKRIFSEYPCYKLENELLLDVDGYEGKLSFNSNHWDNQGYETVLKRANGKDFYFTSVELSKGRSYHDEWEKVLGH